MNTPDLWSYRLGILHQASWSRGLYIPPDRHLRLGEANGLVAQGLLLQGAIPRLPARYSLSVAGRQVMETLRDKHPKLYAEVVWLWTLRP